MHMPRGLTFSNELNKDKKTEGEAELPNCLASSYCGVAQSGKPKKKNRGKMVIPHIQCQHVVSKRNGKQIILISFGASLGAHSIKNPDVLSVTILPV